MPNFSDWIMIWLFLGVVGVGYTIQIWFVDLLLDRFKKDFDVSKIFVPLYLFLTWVAAGEFVIMTYLFCYMMA